MEAKRRATDARKNAVIQICRCRKWGAAATVSRVISDIRSLRLRGSLSCLFILYPHTWPRPQDKDGDGSGRGWGAVQSQVF